jgi:hypothetical protein
VSFALATILKPFAAVVVLSAAAPLAAWLTRLVLRMPDSRLRRLLLLRW